VLGIDVLGSTKHPCVTRRAVVLGDEINRRGDEPQPKRSPIRSREPYRRIAASESPAYSISPLLGSCRVPAEPV
jgi:hypothetical protein